MHNADHLPSDCIQVCRQLLDALDSRTDGFRRQNTPALLYKYLVNMGHVFRQVAGLLRPNAPFALVVGPPAMYRPVVRALTETGLPEGRILLSLERTMRCGVGKCGHCAIGDRLCCTDGPVFSYTEIKDCAEALG